MHTPTTTLKVCNYLLTWKFTCFYYLALFLNVRRTFIYSYISVQQNSWIYTWRDTKEIFIACFIQIAKTLEIQIFISHIMDYWTVVCTYNRILGTTTTTKHFQQQLQQKNKI